MPRRSACALLHPIGRCSACIGCALAAQCMHVNKSCGVGAHWVHVTLDIDCRHPHDEIKGAPQLLQSTETVTTCMPHACTPPLIPSDAMPRLISKGTNPSRTPLAESRRWYQETAHRYGCQLAASDRKFTRHHASRIPGRIGGLLLSGDIN